MQNKDHSAYVTGHVNTDFVKMCINQETKPKSLHISNHEANVQYFAHQQQSAVLRMLREHRQIFETRNQMARQSGTRAPSQQEPQQSQPHETSENLQYEE